jgi:hypothetical protein
MNGLCRASYTLVNLTPCDHFGGSRMSTAAWIIVVWLGLQLPLGIFVCRAIAFGMGSLRERPATDHEERASRQRALGQLLGVEGHLHERPR